MLESSNQTGDRRDLRWRCRSATRPGVVCHRRLHLYRDAILPHVGAFQQAIWAGGIALELLPGSKIQLYEVALHRCEYEAGKVEELGTAFRHLSFKRRPA